MLQPHCPANTPSSLFAQEISLESSADPPRLLLEGDGRLYFKPTCVGASSTRLFTIKNCSRLPLYFGWRIQPADGKVLAVKPSTGFLQPNEALVSAGTKTGPDVWVGSGCRVPHSCLLHLSGPMG